MKCVNCFKPYVGTLDELFGSFGPPNWLVVPSAEAHGFFLFCPACKREEK